jgi:hypothetical protein
MSPKKPQLDNITQTMRNVASAELHQSMGKFKTGGNKNRAEKRNSTRTDQRRNAIKDQE